MGDRLAMLGIGRWRRVETRNILSPANLVLLHEALDPSLGGNIVFGFHYYYAGGRCKTDIATRSALDLIREIGASRAGDHFTLYSLAQLVSSADVVLPVDHGSAESVNILTAEIRARSMNTELVVLLDTPIPQLDVFYELDDQDLVDLRSAWLLPDRGKGEAYAFRMHVLDEAVDGSTIHSITGPLPRLRALLDAKRPRPDGCTPSSGPY